MVNNRFKNKVVIVTGASQGIGKNIARAFGKEEAQVIIAGLNKDRGRKTVLEFNKDGIKVWQLAIDLSKAGAAAEVVKRVVRKWGRVDILINNARAGLRKTLLEETEESWQQTMSVSLQAAFFASQEAVRSMTKIGGGVIVNISSTVAKVIGHDSPSYHIAKAGMVQMTKYLAVHAGKFGVRVNCILPGFIIADEYIEKFESSDNKKYKRIADFSHPLGITGRSDDVARTVLFLCSKEASYINGAALTLDGGMTIQDQSNILFRFVKSKKK